MPEELADLTGMTCAFAPCTGPRTSPFAADAAGPAPLRYTRTIMTNPDADPGRAALSLPYGPIAGVVAAALGPAATLGLARFSYALLLPEMKADLGLSYAQSGWLNTANAIGYLLGAIPASRVIDRAGAYRTLVASMFATLLTLLFAGSTRDVDTIAWLRLLAGIFGAMAFIAGGSLAARVAGRDPRRQSFLIAIYMGGVGFGIALSGLAVPGFLAAGIRFAGRNGWQSTWIALAGLSLALTVCALALAPRDRPAGGSAERSSARWPVGRFVPILASYFLYGMGYIGYMTFIVAYIGRQGFGPVGVTVFWSLLGMASMASAWVWAGRIERLAGGRATAGLTAILALANALPLLSDHPVAIVASAAIFGISFTSLVASIISIFRRNLPDTAMAPAIGMMTAVFAAGQIVGPVASGALADAMGSLGWSLGFAVLLLGFGAAVALLQRDLDTRMAR